MAQKRANPETKVAEQAPPKRKSPQPRPDLTLKLFNNPSASDMKLLGTDGTAYVSKYVMAHASSHVKKLIEHKDFNTIELREYSRAELVSWLVTFHLHEKVGLLGRNISLGHYLLLSERFMIDVKDDPDTILSICKPVTAKDVEEASCVQGFPKLRKYLIDTYVALGDWEMPKVNSAWLVKEFRNRASAFRGRARCRRCCHHRHLRRLRHPVTTCAQEGLSLVFAMSPLREDPRSISL